MMHGETSMHRELMTYGQAVNSALDLAMARDPRVIVIGEGVPDPKAIFGTTAGLRERYGPDRVFDMPLSENGATGICIGAALSGLKPVMVHQRIDFALLAMDQLVNNAAKWHYMFDGRSRVPLVVRVIVGRGWGQGPQHSQSLQSIFAHIPGLKVVMPATPHDAKGLLMAAIEDDNPVVFIEHRWLHGLSDMVPVDGYTVEIGKSRLLHEGEHVTIAGFSYAIMEALRVGRALSEIGIGVDVVDMRSVRPLDDSVLLESVRRTHHLVVVDTAWPFCGVSSELIARVGEKAFGSLHRAPKRFTLEDHPAPTSPHMIGAYYPTQESLATGILELLGVKLSDEWHAQLLGAIRSDGPVDVPQRSFAGPF
jgi:pyruvate dehydrogenase E1 component beta subunit